MELEKGSDVRASCILPLACTWLILERFARRDQKHCTTFVQFLAHALTNTTETHVAIQSFEEMRTLAWKPLPMSAQVAQDAGTGVAK